MRENILAYLSNVMLGHVIYDKTKIIDTLQNKGFMYADLRAKEIDEFHTEITIKFGDKDEVNIIFVWEKEDSDLYLLIGVE